MTAQRRQILSAVLGTGLLFLLLLLVSLDDLFQPEPPATVQLTQVQIYVEPPPPPPAQEQKSSSSSSPQMMLSMQENQVALQAMDINVDLPEGDFSNFGTGTAGLGEGMGMNWGTVGLSDLDAYPTVLAAPTLTYPNAAIADNIDTFTVKFHIVIDETGHTYPVRIVENPYPALDEELERYVSQVRFTPPVKLGVPVRTQYLWPVIFKRN